MRTAPLLLLTVLFAVSCAPRAEAPPPAPEPEAAAPSVEQLWIDFCHYVVIASPELATAYGRRLAEVASPEQLRALLADDDSTTRRTLRLRHGPYVRLDRSVPKGAKC